jgi:hypothetical protein
VVATGGIHAVEQAYVEENSARVVTDEVFVAVTTRANCGTKAGAHGFLKRFGDIIRSLTDLDAPDGIRFGGWPTQIVALPQSLKTWILS